MFCIIAVCTNIATCLVETVLNNHTKRILGICEVYRTAVSVAINYVREFKQGGEFPSSYHVVVVFNDLRKLFVLLILEELFN
jgi:hypothetical protein